MPPAIPIGLEDYLAALMERSLHDALIFSERIAKATSVMSQAGMTADAISIALNEDLLRGGKIFGELSNSIKSGINEGVNQSGRLGQAEQYPPGEKNYSWVTVAGHKVCPDCDARTGEVRTWDEWVGEGLPGSGWSICGGHCYCVLDPVGKCDSRIEGTPPGVKEPGATIRPKAPTGSKMEKRFYKDYKLTKNQIKEIKVADAIIFSSANAVNISRNYLNSFSNKVFCVGDDTKVACLKNNIKNVSSSDGNINDLINLITKKIKDRSKKLVYISAKQTAVNLPLILKSKKIYVKKIVIYESKK